MNLVLCKVADEFDSLVILINVIINTEKKTCIALFL